VCKVYFEDAEGLDNHFFPYAKEEAQRRRGGFEEFYDFTYRATVKPRIAEEWTSGEITKACWDNDLYRDATAASFYGNRPYTYSLNSASPHSGDGPALIRTEWVLQWPQGRPPGFQPRTTLFLPEATYQRDVLLREADLWTVDDLDALLPED
jgi:hypothetical protein